MKYFLSFIILSISYLATSQKKQLDHTVYNDWKKLNNTTLSKDGNFVSYTINPYKGDGWLYIYNKKKNTLDSIHRGYNPTFSDNNTFVTFLITAGFDTLRNCELNKVKKEDWPTDTLAIYLLEKDSLIKIPNVKSFKVAEQSDWIHYLLNDNKLKSEEPIKDTTAKDSSIVTVTEKTPEKWWKFKKLNFLKKKPAVEVAEKKEKKKKPESDGKLYFAINPMTSKEVSYKDITEFYPSLNGKYVALISHKKEDKKSTYRLKIIDPLNNEIQLETNEKTAITSVVFSYDEKSIAFLSSNDTTKTKQFELSYGIIKNGKTSVVLDTASTLLNSKLGVSENRKLSFSFNNKELFFGVSDRVKQEPKDSLLDSEKAKLDLWSYTDKRLQPQQLVELKEDKKKTDLYVYHTDLKTINKLSNDSLNVNLPRKLKSNYLIASNEIPYQASYQWDSPFRKDHYRISVLDGKIEPLHLGTGFGGQLSPLGNFYTYYDGAQKEHLLVDVKTKKTTCINCERKDVKWEEDLNGTPQLADAFGIIGWLKDEKAVLIQSEFDVWKYELETKSLTALTKEKGWKSTEKFGFYNGQKDSLFMDVSNGYFIGTSEITHATTIYNSTTLDTLYFSNHALVDLDVSDNQSSILLRKSSVKDYPEALLLDVDFKNERQVSKTNPQQSAYNWATVEKIKWTSYDGIELEGLVYKPEDFNEDKSYPMIVYYYELSTDGFHNHSAPRPTASIIYPTEYASAGYVVFIPNIRYREGHPAKSAYDCIMSGTDKVLKLYPNIDSKKMGLQGQSWGGYQTAQLVTMTDRYAAAMAGAPVANMFSAYGGIRWGTGFNRQFQYEKQQSRIGKTIWEAPELYYENSPLFHIPKIKTPLLIMSNDNDGAVPWYQGIEMYTGMKRLGKPCWMLNYNGDEHNLMIEANRFDLSIRMRQFFDYYLQDAPAPKWLIEGIPAVDKGKDYKLELVK